MGASIAHERVAGEASGHEDAEEALFAAARAHAEAMIVWAGSEQSLALEHEQLESETMKAGFEFMRLLTQARLDLRAARERRRDDVTDADGDARTICEDGHERGPGDDLRAGDNLADRLPQERIPWTTSWSCRGG